MPSIGMITDGDGAVRTTDRMIDMWESRVWSVILELAEVAAGVDEEIEGQRRIEEHVSKFFQDQESSPTIAANSS